MTIPEELLPVIEWWEKDGKKTLAVAAVAAVAVAGYYGVKGWREARSIAAGEAFLNSETVEELESAVASYGGTRTGAALKLRLAKAYYDAGSCESAAELYRSLDGAAPEGFEDVPALGLAECLEAQERFAEAIAAYEAFAEERPASPFALGARIGAARCLVQSGERDKAMERLAALKEEVRDDDSATALVEAAEDLAKRWEKRSLFDTADAVAETLKQAGEPATAQEPEVVPAETAPLQEEVLAADAPAAPAETPAPAPAAAEAPAPAAEPESAN